MTDTTPIPTAPLRDPLVEITLPVLNEEAALVQSVTTLSGYLRENFPYRWQITVVDNGSTDHTWEIATRLAATDTRVRAIHLDVRGRGLALRTAWSQSEADIVSYMDIDLSTGLEAFLPLIAPLVAGQCAVATGSRLSRGAIVTRSPKREVISRGYNALIRLLFWPRFPDAQCGFKALTRDAAHRLLPLVENDHWFFDTELLLAAEEQGMRVHQVPVRWVEDPDTRVKIAKTMREDLAGLARVRGQRWQRALQTMLDPAKNHTNAAETRQQTNL